MSLTWRKHELLKPPTPEEMARMEPQALADLWQVYHEAIENAERDPYRYGFKLPHWEDAEALLREFNEILVSGGNRCVDAATTYVKNAETLDDVRFDNVWEGMPVFSYDETTGGVEIGFASKPFIKGFEEMVKIELTNGGRIVCTPAHRLYLVSGEEISAAELSIGDQLLCLFPRKDADPCERVAVKNISAIGKKTVWDVTVEKYGNYLANGVFHHNSSKTSWAASAVVKAAMENPGSVIMAFAQNADVSIRQQQTAVYDALPEELRKKQLGAETNISYTRKNGFSKSSLILPNRSHIIFKTYAQFLNNDTILEGAELGSREPTWINIGAWCDEYLIGPELLATLRFRLATRNAKLVVTFTPIDGYTEVVRDYLAGAKTIRSKVAELLDNERVPYIQHSKNRNAGIIFFHSKDNPFGGYERIAEDLKNRPREEILTRAYGIPTKSISTLFPLFSREINVVPHDRIPTKDVTRYHVVDPAGSKNFFMLWCAVDAQGTYWIYKEWPDVSIGDWGKWHGGKWIAGQGAKGLGYGIRDYVDLIGREEEGTEIFERLIDPRLGAAKYQRQDGTSSIIEEMAEAGLTFIAAPGVEIEDGIQAIQSKLAYVRSRPLDSINRPHLYISDRCQNLITAMQEYTGQSSEEIWKDPIDCLRYLCIDGVGYVSPDSLTGRRSKRGAY